MVIEGDRHIKVSADSVTIVVPLNPEDFEMIDGFLVPRNPFSIFAEGNAWIEETKEIEFQHLWDDKQLIVIPIDKVSAVETDFTCYQKSEIPASKQQLNIDTSGFDSSRK